MNNISKRLNLILVAIATLIGSGVFNHYSAKSDLDQRLQEQANGLSTRLKLSAPVPALAF